MRQNPRLPEFPVHAPLHSGPPATLSREKKKFLSKACQNGPRLHTGDICIPPGTSVASVLPPSQFTQPLLPARPQVLVLPPQAGRRPTVQWQLRWRLGSWICWGKVTATPSTGLGTAAHGPGQCWDYIWGHPAKDHKWGSCKQRKFILSLSWWPEPKSSCRQDCPLSVGCRAGSFRLFWRLVAPGVLWSWLCHSCLCLVFMRPLSPPSQISPDLYLLRAFVSGQRPFPQISLLCSQAPGGPIIWGPPLCPLQWSSYTTSESGTGPLMATRPQMGVGPESSRQVTQHQTGASPGRGG